MWKSNIINIKLVAVYVLCNLSFGAFVPEDVAIEIAHNVYIEHEVLHGRDEFIISRVETIISLYDFIKIGKLMS